MDRLSLPMEGALPPDLQGTLFRAGPRPAWASAGLPGAEETEVAAAMSPEGLEPAPLPSGGGGGGGGALHAIELRDGRAASYLWHDSDAYATVFWHAGSVLALPESGLPSQYSRLLEPEEFAGGLTVPVASHVRRIAADAGRVLFSVDDGIDRPMGAPDTDTQAATDADEGVWLRIGEWDADGGLRTAQAVELERATWQHDVGVTERHVVFIESPTTRLADPRGAQVPFGWVPGADAWLGVVPRGGDGSSVRWFRIDPCLVTHVLGAREEQGQHGDVEIVLYVCRYDAPEEGQPVDLSTSVVGPAGVGLSPIGASLGLLERWRVVDDRLERTQVDERHVEYPRIDALCEGEPFRYGYSVELSRGAAGGSVEEVVPTGLLKFDLHRDELASSWSPGPWRRASEPIFVRGVDGHGDDEGWLLTVVDDANTGTSDLYVLDASSLGRHTPEAVIHLPVLLPFRSHGEWVPADRYR